MEKQKIFWVILSVSVFVVVVLVVGVFLLRQKPATVAVEPANSVHTFSDPGTSPYEFGREPGGPEVLNLVIGGESGTSGAGQQAPESQPPVASTQPATPAAQPQVPAPAAKPAATKPAAAATPKPAAPTLQYWIQTGSYKSQTRAEDLAQNLSDKGLAGRVFSYASGSDTYYRVRVGPYANQKEAEKFLATVKQIQGLEASYISQVGGTPGAN